MIARLWYGAVSRPRAKAYVDFLQQTAVPALRATQGNLGAMIFREDGSDQTQVVLLTFWDGEESIAALTGPNVLQAQYFRGERDFLDSLPQEVRHLQVCELCVDEKGEIGPAAL